MTVAFIPARGGSKSIPLKNIKLIAGKPLIYWTAKAASDCELIDRVHIATDSREITETVEKLQIPKVSLVGRSAESATDTASTEAAMLEFAEQHEFDDIVLIQATSPLLTAEDLNGGLELYKSADSVLSVARQKRFHWKINADGVASPTNYDYFNRPRRQDFNGALTENGAFYITSRERLLKTKCRLSGKIKAYEMSEDALVEIDEPSDWAIVERLLQKRRVIPEIKVFLTDCDGCLTDGGMYYTENGDEMKRFNTKDGMGLRLLKDAGIITGIITGESRDLLKRRAKKLGVDISRLGVEDKLSVLREICKEYGVNLENIAYVGDDVNDLEIMSAVGFPCSVADGQDKAKNKAMYVSTRKGGDGAVREIVDFILENRR
ncbi:acylneuraminate cytidylyltransferase [Clostridia bacterium]|nr:acylneuraminate cytidylyltransferase [Clostridia bacterium]